MKKKEMGRLPHLPEEVMMEILLRLPPESLMRFKCVCKSWYAHISDPSFADKHLQFNNRISSSVTLFLNWLRPIREGPFNQHERVRSFVTISDSDDPKDSNNHVPCVIEDLDLSIIPQKESSDFCRASHCNGIIWLAPYSFRALDDEIVLYNPAIRQFKFLPKTSLGRRASLVGGFTWVHGLGFGYDLKANDYKFIKILVDRISKECIAEVYTMASDSWREIQIDITGGDLYNGNGIGLYVKGVCYWDESIHKRILSFDMSSDEFHSIPLPVDKIPGTKTTLAVWNESLALLTSGGVRVHLSIEIWVMNDYHGGVKAPWTKHLSIGPLENYLYEPIMFWKSDELLIGKKFEELVSYNLVTENLGIFLLGCHHSLVMLVSIPRVWFQSREETN